MNAPHKHRDVIKAWADGFQIQMLEPGTHQWVDIDQPQWVPWKEYRVRPMTLTREEVLISLRELQDSDDTESAHSQADYLLCDLLVQLGYEDVVQAWHRIGKWYA